MKSFFLNTFLPRMIWFVVYLWCLTLRKKILNPEIDDEIRTRPGKAIITIWHSHYFYLAYHLRNRGDIYTLVSPSKDGDLVANIGRTFGFKVVRGSSYKKTIPGTRECIRLLKQDYKIGIIADGSRGPRHEAQSGSLELSRITGAPIYTITWDASWKYQFSSWDRFILPLPFSRITLNFGSPITVSRDADKETISRKQGELTALLKKITQECE